MFLASNWRDYEVIDCSSGEKLEHWGKYTLLRPDPQVIWKTPKDNPSWKKLNAHYHRSDKGGGEWEFFDLPEEWKIGYDLSIGEHLTFNLKPFHFKHTGLFPEQAANWDWFSSIIKREKEKNPGKTIKVLNLFAYTGGATIAAAAAGAEVTHVDASKGMVTWAKENAVSSGLGDAHIRWLVDDCKKFVEREIRRGNKYDAIIMIEKAAIQEDGSVVLDDDVQVSAGSGTMPAGATVSAGRPIMKAGRVIRPTDLAALCMGGHSAVKVRKRPVVAFIPTGSELVAYGTRPKRGQTIDANSLMCKNMLESYGARVIKFPIVRDDLEALEEAFTRALELADLVVVNGGSALGDEDFNVRMIEKRGRVVHHYIAAAPGRPLMMAVADGKLKY